MAAQKFLMKYVNRIFRFNAVVYNERLQKYDLTKSQHPYIRIICLHPGISQEQITKQLYVNASSVTRQLSLLEKKGLIYRVQDKNDRRISLVYPTEEMLRLFPIAQSVMNEWNEYLLDGFTESEKEVLFSMLDRILARAENAADEVLGGDSD